MRNFLLVTLLWVTLLPAHAIMPTQVRWHDKSQDTTTITNVLIEARENIKSNNPQDYIPEIARKFIGTPYAAGTLESPDFTELLTVRLDSLDCTTYVETVMALARTAADGRTSWRDFINNLESLRYRGGELGPYASRLHYVTDWILNNSTRGNLTEVSTRMPETDYYVKSLNFMSSHHNLYPALSDDFNFEEIKHVEDGYRNNRSPYIKKQRIISDKKFARALKEGDIIALTTSVPGLDVSHLAIITLKDGVPHIIHASSASGKVEVSTIPLADYLKRNSKLTGIRVIRMD